MSTYLRYSINLLPILFIKIVFFPFFFLISRNKLFTTTISRYRSIEQIQFIKKINTSDYATLQYNVHNETTGGVIWHISPAANIDNEQYKD